MSDERYTVILGDRRYAIHRKWAKPNKPFGFLSDLMVDGEGRVHVAQRGTDRPVVVFDRDGREVGRLLGPAEWDGDDARRLIAAAMK